MTKPVIRTYEELMEEKARLTQLLVAQKELVRQDFAGIKKELAPVRTAISTVSKLTTRDNRALLLTTAADSLIDLVIRRMLLARTGWLTKWAVPFIMKNFSSHVIADNKDKIKNMLSKLFGKKNASAQKNGHFEKMGESFGNEEED